MLRRGVDIAKKFGASLPSFPDLATATRYFSDRRKARLSSLFDLAARSGFLSLDFSPDSLKRIELWYFDLHARCGFEDLGTERNTFEEYIATYFGEVVVRNVTGTSWVVKEFAFTKGKYQCSVQQGLGTMMLDVFRDLYKWPDNKKRESIYRMYKKYFREK